MSTISWLEIFDKYNTQEIIMGKILKKYQEDLLSMSLEQKVSFLDLKFLKA